VCKKILLIGDYKILKKFKIIFWGEGNLVLNWKKLWGFGFLSGLGVLLYLG
jgi:hypothetical protein